MKTHVDLRQIRENALQIRRATGVPLIGVVKANAYGLGAVAVADAIQDLVESWYVFAASEGVQYRLWELTGKPTLCALASEFDQIETMRRQQIRPGVWTPEQVHRFRSLDPLLCVDTGMQRFACPVDQVDSMLREYPFNEAYTHAARPDQARLLRQTLGGRSLKLHAAGTSLLSHSECWLDAVRPGLALYANAARVSLPLADARESHGPVGYTQFTSRHHGVILKGYSNGMRPGVCVVNGRRQQVIEVGMQSAFVTLDAADQPGDEVVLLGDGLSLAEAAQAAKSSPHETLLRLASMGEAVYTRTATAPTAAR
jgi:alanine racemase